MEQKRRSIVLLVMAMLAWGSVYPASKYKMAETSPLTMSFHRYFIGTLTLTPFFINEIRKNRNYITKENLFISAAAGLFGVTLLAILLFTGVSLSTASNGSIIVNTQPIFLAFLAPLFIKESVSRLQILGIAAGLAGMVLVVTNGDLSVLSNNRSMFLGNILLAGASLSMSIYSLILKKHIIRWGGFMPTYISMLFGTFFLFIINLFSSRFFSDIRELTAVSDILLILYLGCVSTAFAYLLFNNSLKYIDVVKASGFKFLVPVSGVGLSILFLGERPSIFVYAGVVIVVLSIVLIQRAPKRVLI